MNILKSIQKTFAGKGKEKGKDANPPSAEPQPQSTPLAPAIFEDNGRVIEEKSEKSGKSGTSGKSEKMEKPEKSPKEEQSKKQEEEIEELRIHNAKLQVQQRQIVEENDTLISANNELKKKMAGVASCEATIAKLEETTKNLNGVIDKLKAEMKKKDKLIAEYDDKFEKLEEDMQNAQGKERSTQGKASILDSQLAKIAKEAEELRKANEMLSLTKERMANEITQERAENKKAVGILEKNIAYLTKEKHEREKKASGDKSKLDRHSKKCINAEIQTESTDSCEPISTGKESVASLSAKLNDK